jgi:GNAT superfamily N-acetyltransferase
MAEIENIATGLALEYVSINFLREEDIPVIVAAFAANNWPKPAHLFEGYLKEQQNKERLIWVAYIDEQSVGYLTLKWQSQYEYFALNNIPEIMDLNVLPAFRKQGVASRLLEVAEEATSSQSDIVGIGVGLYGGADGGYGSAQKLYVNRGYVPDGRGVTYNYQSATPGDIFPLDDDLVLWFSKKLK